MILIDFNVIAWNVGGALEKRNQIHLKEVVWRWKPEINFLFEVHTQFINTVSFREKLDYVVVAIQEEGAC